MHKIVLVQKNVKTEVSASAQPGEVGKAAHFIRSPEPGFPGLQDLVALRMVGKTCMFLSHCRGSGL